MLWFVVFVLSIISAGLLITAAMAYKSNTFEHCAISLAKISILAFVVIIAISGYSTVALFL